MPEMELTGMSCWSSCGQRLIAPTQSILLSSVVASSPRRRRVLEHRGESRLALALALQPKLELHPPTQVWATLQSCLKLLLCSTLCVVGFRRLCQCDIHQEPEYEHRNQRELVVGIQGNPTIQDRCGVTGILLRSECERDLQLLDGPCKLDILQLPFSSQRWMQGTNPRSDTG